MAISEAESFVTLLAQCGNQGEAAAVIGCSRANVSRKLTDARKLLGDARVLELIELHARNEKAGITLRKFFTMESKTCGVCGSAKICQPSGKWRCNACRNARYREAHPVAEGVNTLSPEDAAVKFVVLLAQAGNQAEAAKVIGKSKAVVSDRLKKARKTLGDERVKELMLANLRDDNCRAGLLKPFILNQPICGKCGGERTPLPSTGELVCRACANVRNAEYKARHEAKVRAARADYREKNREVLLLKSRAYRATKPERDAAYYQANSERIKANVREYRAANKDRLSAYFKSLDATPTRREQNKARLRAWKKRNPDKVNADTARRQLRLRQAYVEWADDSLIAEAYALAKLRTELTGIPWEVDHIVPLNSDLVCGLHWEGNLQVIPARTNLAKSNDWWPDMPGDVRCFSFQEFPSNYVVLAQDAPLKETLCSGY